MLTQRTTELPLTAALILLGSGLAISSEDWDEGTYVVMGEEGEFIDEEGEWVALECSNVNDTWYLVERITEVTDESHFNV